jgi:hypothetical protein
METKCKFDVINNLVLKCIDKNMPCNTRRAALAELPVQDHPENILKLPVQTKNPLKEK